MYFDSKNEKKWVCWNLLNFKIKKSISIKPYFFPFIL